MDEFHEFILEGKDVPLERRIVYKLLRDATDRRGWRQEFDQFDDDVKEELIATWIAIVNGELTPF